MKRKWFEMMITKSTVIIFWGDAIRENAWFWRPGIVPVENYQPAPGKLLPCLVHTDHIYK